MNTLKTTNEALLSERVRALEKQCAVLAAEVDRVQPLVQRVREWLLSKGSPARAIVLSKAYVDYEASAPK